MKNTNQSVQPAFNHATKRLLLLLLVVGWTGLARADEVTEWNETAANAAIATGMSTADGSFDPLHESRILAMMHAAIHDALNAIDRRFQPYALDTQTPAGSSPEAAVAAAAHDVLSVLFPQIPDLFPSAPATALVEAAYAASLASIADSPAKTEGILVGKAAAATILASDMPSWKGSNKAPKWARLPSTTFCSRYTDNQTACGCSTGWKNDTVETLSVCLWPLPPAS